MNPEQPAEDVSIFNEWYKNHQDLEQITIPHEKARFIWSYATKEERVRILSALNKIDASKHNSMSLMLEMKRIIRGES